MHQTQISGCFSGCHASVPQCKYSCMDRAGAGQRMPVLDMLLMSCRDNALLRSSTAVSHHDHRQFFGLLRWWSWHLSAQKEQ